VSSLTGDFGSVVTCDTISAVQLFMATFCSLQDSFTDALTHPFDERLTRFAAACVILFSMQFCRVCGRIIFDCLLLNVVLV
jgi:hypothetical protein